MTDDFDIEVYLEGHLVGRVPLPSSGLTIGRAPTSGLVLNDRMASKAHASLQVEGNRVTVRDLGSTEGTFLRGVRVSSATLSSGDELRIGFHVLRLVPRSSKTPADAGPGAHDLDEFHRLVQNLVGLTGVVGIADVQAVLETLLDRTMGIVTASVGFVVLVTGDRFSPILARKGDPSAQDESFSRTICQQALDKGEPVVLVAGTEAPHTIASLTRTNPLLVLGIPLIDAGRVLGILYLESKRLLPRPLELQPGLLKELSLLGGRALKVAVERRQIVREQERWRWLASDLAEEPDLSRSVASQSMQKVLSVVQRVASEDVTVLILGESGTGKEVVSREIHRLSPRSSGPFIAVNCGALPRDLMEAELFGHEKGAFTGAAARKLGRFELAEGGTLLLDEVGDMPRDLQVKLLRVLESRRFERLGGQESVKLDVRLIAATNRDLEEAVKRGEFRDDLYYRLNVISIRIPPLRDRPEDIQPLVNEMLLAANRRFRNKLLGVTPEALAILESYGWPGNVRELRNVIDRAFILESNDRITPDSLPFAGQAKALPGGRPAGPPPAQPLASPRPVSEEALLPLDEFVARQEEGYIRLVLDRVGGNMSAAARILGVNRTTLYKKMKRGRPDAGDDPADPAA